MESIDLLEILHLKKKKNLVILSGLDHSDLEYYLLIFLLYGLLCFQCFLLHYLYHLLSSLALEILFVSLLEIKLLVKYPFCFYSILFLSSLKWLSEFFCCAYWQLFEFYQLQSSMSLSLVSGEVSLSFCDTLLLWFFTVLDMLYLCPHIWWSEYLSY